MMSLLPLKVLCINYCMTCAEGLHFSAFHLATIDLILLLLQMVGRTIEILPLEC